MKDFKDDIEISEIIYKHFRNQTTEDEEKLLSAWKLNTSNHKLLNELQKPEFLYEGVSDSFNIPVEKPLKEIKKRIFRFRCIKIFKYTSGIAAILIFIFLFPYLLYNSTSNNEQLPILQSAQNASHNDKNIATLVTTGGNILYLEDSVNQQQTVINPKKFVQHQELEKYTFNSLSTSQQGNIKITLYDSTIVWLNGQSELKYANTFIDNKRIVYLKGEAYFKVKSDKTHPFIVHTSSAQVNVMGTSFNVDACDSTCVTTLVEGHVRMQNLCKDSIELFCGQQAIMARDGKIDLKEVDTRYYTCWMDNLFAFKDTPLKQIMQVLEEWYGKEFYFEDDDLAEIVYTTTVTRAPEITNILEILSKVGDFKYKEKNNIIIITRR